MSPQTLENVRFSKNYVEILCAAALRSRGTPVPGFRAWGRRSLRVQAGSIQGFRHATAMVLSVSGWG